METIEAGIDETLKAKMLLEFEQAISGLGKNDPFRYRLLSDFKRDLEKKETWEKNINGYRYYFFLINNFLNPENYIDVEQIKDFKVTHEKQKQKAAENHYSESSYSYPSGAQQKIEKFNAELKKANVSEMHKGCTFDNYIVETDEQKKVIERLKTENEKWFLFLGNTGTGKNHLAAAIIRNRLLDGKTAIIWRVKKLIDELLGATLEEKRDMLRELYDVDLLIINELGRSTDKKFFQDTLFDLLDERHENFKQTIIISNLSKEGIYGMFDEALQRKLSESAITIEFDWQSYKGGAK